MLKYCLTSFLKFVLFCPKLLSPVGPRVTAPWLSFGIQACYSDPVMSCDRLGMVLPVCVDPCVGLLD